jgi:hypothetical protein
MNVTTRGTIVPPPHESGLAPISRVQITRLALEDLGPDEAQLIVGALLQYRTTLRESLERVEKHRTAAQGEDDWAVDNPKGLVSGGFEDEAFCHHELAKISQFLFELVYDHEQPEKVEQIHKFLDDMLRHW